MATKSTIAIIGSSGRMGSAIAKSLAKRGHKLLLFGRSSTVTDGFAEELASSYPESEIEGIDCQVNACWEADIIILAVPYSAEAEVAAQIKPYVTQKIVISISNPMTENMDGMLTPPHSSSAEELQELLRDAHVVKAFNTNFAKNFDEPIINGQPVDSYIAGDNESAVQIVSNLVADIGFRAITVGKLATSHTLEHMQLLLIQLNIEKGYEWQAGWKVLHH